MTKGIKGYLTIIVVASIFIVSMIAISACGQNAAKSTRDTGSAGIINFPANISNVADKCDHGNRVYVSDHLNSNSSSIAVVAHDPSCPQPVGP